MILSNVSMVSNNALISTDVSELLRSDSAHGYSSEIVMINQTSLFSKVKY